ncbi:MAG: hypothetical protein AW07_04198 [Candidatus Accumulibacter sp. SK-11]|nr:MAG: hypothetical protein AW07_04198 [Candidatus Accumulibacter sp. SK-11]
MAKSAAANGRPTSVVSAARNQRQRIIEAGALHADA